MKWWHISQSCLTLMEFPNDLHEPANLHVRNVQHYYSVSCACHWKYSTEYLLGCNKDVIGNVEYKRLPESQWAEANQVNLLVWNCWSLWRNNVSHFALTICKCEYDINTNNENTNNDGTFVSKELKRLGLVPIISSLLTVSGQITVSSLWYR